MILMILEKIFKDSIGIKNIDCASNGLEAYQKAIS